MSTAYKKIEEILKIGMSSYFRLFYSFINSFSTLIYNLSTVENVIFYYFCIVNL